MSRKSLPFPMPLTRSRASSTCAEKLFRLWIFANVSETKIVQSDKRNRILVVELENKLLGLIVSSASEVLKIPPSEIEAPGTVFAEGESSYVTGVGKLKGRLVIILDIARLLRQPEFKKLEEAAEPVAMSR